MLPGGLYKLLIEGTGKYVRYNDVRYIRFFPEEEQETIE